MSTPAEYVPQQNLTGTGSEFPATPGYGDVSSSFGIPGGPVYVPQPTGEDVAALIGTPPPAPPGFVGPPAPAPTPDVPVSSFATDAWGTLGGFGGSIFGSRRYRPSRLERELEAAARRIGRAAIRGAASAFEYVRRAPIPSESTALVPYVEKGSKFFGPIGALLGTAIGLAFPEHVGEITTPEALARLPLTRGATPPGWERANRGIERDLRGINRPVDLLPTGQYPLGFPTDVVLPAEIAQRKKLGIEGAIEDALPPGLRAAIKAMRNPTPAARMTTPQPANAGPPKPAGYGSTAYGQIPNSTASPASSSPTTHNVTLPRPNIQWGKIGIGLGAIFAVNLIASRAGRSSGPGTPAPVFVTPTPGMTNTPAPSPVASILTGNVLGGGSAGGYCETRPSGPRRRCLERAPVSWRGGRNKGKAAGTKCVRFAQRKS